MNDAEERWPELAPARYSRRALACMIDIIVGLSPFWLLLPMIIVLNGNAGASDRLAADALLLLAPLPSFALYMAIQLVQISRSRPTLGRRIAGIGIVKMDGSRTGPKEAAIRQVLGVFLPVSILFISGTLPLILLLGLCSFVEARQRSGPDLASGTQVIIAKQSINSSIV